jgi:predicted nucleotidyltransferase
VEVERRCLPCQANDNFRLKAVRYLQQHDPVSIGILGSYARGDARPDSDLALLAEFREPKSLLTLMRIERKLSEALGIKADILTERSISPYLIDRIKAELKVVYS